MRVCLKYIKWGGVTDMINMIIVLIILFSITILRLDLYKKKADKITIELENFECIKSMLRENNVNFSINIEIRKEFQYRPRDNSIGVKSYTSKKCSEVIPSLHEIGH